mgnify:CR=1 FL=1
MQNKFYKVVMGLFGALLFLCLSQTADAQKPKNIGKVVTVEGTATAIRGKSKVQLKQGDAIFEHDVFETGPKGKLAVTFSDNTSFAIGSGSRIAVDTYFFDPKALKGNMLAKVKKGTMMVRTGQLTRQQPGSVRIKTPRTVLGVRGTTFVVTVDP